MIEFPSNTVGKIGFDIDIDNQKLYLFSNFKNVFDRIDSGSNNLILYGENIGLENYISQSYSLHLVECDYYRDWFASPSKLGKIVEFVDHFDATGSFQHIVPISNPEDLTTPVDSWYNITGSNHFPQFSFFHSSYNWGNPLVSGSLVTDLPSTIDKKFLLLNGYFQPGRALFFKKIKDKFSNLDDFKYSDTIYYKQPEKDKIYDLYSTFENYFATYLTSSCHHYTSSLVDTYKETNSGNVSFIPHFKSQLDWPHTTYYENTFLEIVQEVYSETNISNHEFRNKSILFSSHTIMPMLAKRPFVVNANPGYLENLRSLGFQTFGSWIDESYDSDNDYESRTDKLVSVIETFHSQSSDQLLTTLRNMESVLNHNRTTALNYLQSDTLEFTKKSL